MKDKSKGITLIALVITIIILLILAGITIVQLQENGLFQKAQRAGEITNEVTAKEELETKVYEVQIEKEGNATLQDLVNYLDEDKENNYVISLTKTAKVTGVTNVGEVTEIYVLYKGYEFKISGNLKIEFEGKSASSGNASGEGNSEAEKPNDQLVDPTTPATNVEEAKSDYMLIKTVNSPIEDAFGNKITIPAGFKIKSDSTTNNAETVNKGIVVVDSDENEFVWIPVPQLVEGEGRIYTNAEKTEYKNVELNRYTFDEEGVPSAQNEAAIKISEDSFEEKQTSIDGITPAKSITNFKQSVANNKGYYVGRYEARTEEPRSSKDDPITPISTKGVDSIYNYVTQPQAAELSGDMYDSTKPFTSDLMNSYAWDTATLFLQRCGTDSTYSIKKSGSVSESIALTGTNNQTTKDIQCNVYDMASNMYEWTTEHCKNSYLRNHVSRGGISEQGYHDATSSRKGVMNNFSCGVRSFRPILYM